MKLVVDKLLRPVLRRITPPYLSPVDLFVGGEQGCWYAPSNLSALFQDSIGSTPVTAATQPVGLALDQKKGLVLGVETVNNGTFSSSSSWSPPSNNASITGGQFVFDGVTSIVGNAFLSINTPAVAPVVGKFYQVSFTISSDTTLPVYIRFGGVPTIGQSSPGTYTQYVVAINTSAATVFTGSGTGVRTGAIDNVSVRELPGNHALQATAGSRPTLALQSNQFHLSGGSINWTAPAGTYTVAYLADTGPTILTAQSLSGATNVMAVSKIFEYVAVNRALTADETQGLLDYFDLKGRYL